MLFKLHYAQAYSKLHNALFNFLVFMLNNQESLGIICRRLGYIRLPPETSESYSFSNQVG